MLSRERERERERWYRYNICSARGDRLVEMLYLAAVQGKG